MFPRIFQIIRIIKKIARIENQYQSIHKYKEVYQEKVSDVLLRIAFLLSECICAPLSQYAETTIVLPTCICVLCFVLCEQEKHVFSNAARREGRRKEEQILLDTLVDYVFIINRYSTYTYLALGVKRSKVPSL